MPGGLRKCVRQAFKANSGGSSNELRADVQCGLAVVRIATVHQLWRLLCPQAKENKFARGVLNDLARKRLVVKHGIGEDGRDIWGYDYRWPYRSRGAVPRRPRDGRHRSQAGTSAAAGYGLAVTDTIVAFIRACAEANLPGPDPALEPGFIPSARREILASETDT
ncbi:hypothetical protein ACFVT9_37095 [Kitasatospora cineracea]|uniref:hypothetical protein n=1 Tax=Kitasatospora cineracea TaxID=88074 RepID=UPI0036DC36E4